MKKTRFSLMLCLLIGIIFATQQDIKTGTYNPFNKPDLAAYDTINGGDTLYSDTLNFWTVYHSGWYTMEYCLDSIGGGDLNVFTCFKEAMHPSLGFFNEDTIDTTACSLGDESWLRTTDIDQFFHGVYYGQIMMIGKGHAADSARFRIDLAPVAK